MKVRLIANSLFFIIWMGIIFGLVYSYQWGRTLWIEFLLEWADKEYFSVQLNELLTKERFILIHLFFFIFCSVLIAIRVWIWRTCLQFYSGSKKYFEEIVFFYKSLAINELRIFLFLLVLFFGRTFYLNHSLALQYDEVWNFVHFSSRGMFFSWLAPHNNHILYTIISSFFYQIGIDSFWSVRLPNLVVSLFSICLIYYFLRARYNQYLAMTVLVLIFATGHFTFYSYLGRGYGLSLFFMLLIWVLFDMLSRNSVLTQTETKLFVLVASFLGILSNYNFLLFLVPFYLINLIYAKEPFLKWKQIGFICIMLSIMLLPQVLGLLISLNNQQVLREFSFLQHLAYFDLLADWFFFGKGYDGISFLLLALVLPVFFFSSFIEKKLMAILLALVVILTFGGLHLPERTWHFIPVFLILLWPFQRWSKSSIPVLIPIIIIWTYFSFNHYFIRWSASIDKDMLSLQQRMKEMSIDKTQEIYLFSKYEKPFIEFYLNENSPSLFMYYPDSKNFLPWESFKGEWVLVDYDNFKPPGEIVNLLKSELYTRAYQDPRLVLYHKK